MGNVQTVKIPAVFNKCDIPQMKSKSAQTHAQLTDSKPDSIHIYRERLKEICISRADTGDADYFLSVERYIPTQKKKRFLPMENTRLQHLSQTQPDHSSHLRSIYSDYKHTKPSILQTAQRTGTKMNTCPNIQTVYWPLSWSI
jgi:hypothetical protein